MEPFLRVLRDIVLLAARIVAGVTLVAHGWYRWQIEGLEGQTAVVSSFGLPSAEGLATATVAFEIIGGILLIFGLGTPVIGLGMVAMNVAIILTTRADGGFYQHDGGWEYNLVLATLGLVFLAFGSGRAGLDYLFVQPKEPIAPMIEPDPRDRALDVEPPPGSSQISHS